MEIWFAIANGQISSIVDRVICPDTLVFSFPEYKLRKYQWIFSKLGMCIDNVEIWFRFANGKFRQFLTELSARNTSVFSYQDSE